MKEKIAIIIPRLAGDGAERVVSNLSLHLSEKYQRYIIVYDKTNIVYPYKGDLISIDTKATANHFGKMKNFIKRIYCIRKIKKQLGIQTTISFMKGPSVINILTKNEDKIIVSVRNFISKSSKGFYGKLYKILIKIFYNSADSIVVVSKAIKDDLVKNFKINEDKIKVIYNPYDIKNIKKLANVEIEDEYKEIFNHPVTINVGRLSEQKGQWHLIRAFKKVKEEIPGMKLVILGQGKLEKHLKNLVHECGLEKDVYFLGFQKNPFKYISRSEIFVLSSLYEGFPNALVEAMVCGLPVISSDCKSGPREILSLSDDTKMETKTIIYSDYGVLVPVCDGDWHGAAEPLEEEELMLAKSINDLYCNKEILRNYKYMSKERSKCFDVKKIILDYEDVLR